MILTLYGKPYSLSETVVGIATSWTVQGSNPVESEIFRIRPDRICGPPSPLHNEYRVFFLGVKRPELGVDHPPPSSVEVKESEARYSSPNIVGVIKSRRMRWAGHVARMGEERGAYRVLLGKPDGKRPLGRPRRRWVDNIRMDLQEVGCGYVDWIGLAQDRNRWRTLVSAVMNLRVP